MQTAIVPGVGNNSHVLLGHAMCPFAQRAYLMLELSQPPIPYQHIEIDLSQKSDWFLTLNPKGLVPVFRSNTGEIITESENIVSHLLQNFPDHYQHFGKSQDQLPWREKIQNELIPLNCFYRDEIRNFLREITEMIKGPFLCGEEITTADVSLFPMLSRIENAGFYLEEKIIAWLEKMRENEKIKGTERWPAWMW